MRRLYRVVRASIYDVYAESEDEAQAKVAHGIIAIRKLREDLDHIEDLEVSVAEMPPEAVARPGDPNTWSD